MKKIGSTTWGRNLSIFNDNKGFFQGNGSGGVKFDLGAGFQNLGQNLKKGLMGKPCEGQPGVCPYTCKPLQTPEEKASGVSNEAKAQGATPEGPSSPLQNIGENAVTGRQIMATPQAMSNPLIAGQLDNKMNLINNAGGLKSLSGTGALQAQNTMRMRTLGGAI